MSCALFLSNKQNHTIQDKYAADVRTFNRDRCFNRESKSLYEFHIIYQPSIGTMNAELI